MYSIMKKISISILFVFILLVSFSCSKEEYSFELYHHYTGGIKNLLSVHFNSFAKNNPNITIHRIFKNWQDIEKLMEKSKETASVKFRDAFVIAHDRIGQLAQAGFIQDITPYINKHKNEFHPNVLEAMKYKGKYYGYPLSSECITLFYNKKLIKKPPTTMKEIMALRAKYLKPAQGRYLLLFPKHIPYFTLPWFFAYGGRLFDDNGNAKVNFAFNDAAFMRVKQLLGDKLRIPFMEESMIREKFIKGKVPFIITGPWNIELLKVAKCDFGVAKIPTLNNGKQVGTFIGVQCVVLSRLLSKEQRLQFEKLFDHLRINGFSKKMSLLTKFSSPFKKDHKDKEIKKDSMIASFNKQIKSGFPMNNTPEMAKIWKAFHTSNMKRILSRPMKLTPFLNQLQKRVERLEK